MRHETSYSVETREKRNVLLVLLLSNTEISQQLHFHLSRIIESLIR